MKLSLMNTTILLFSFIVCLKIEENFKLQAKTKAIVEVDLESFTEAVEYPHNFHLFALFNARHNEHCQSCPTALKMVETISIALKKSNNENYFTEIDSVAHSQIFKALKIKTVPKLIYFPPFQKSEEKQTALHYFDFPIGTTMEDLKEFVEMYSGLSVR